VTVDATETVTLTPLNSSPKHRLGEWGATAICGNDITSSCLYVAALATIYGGAYAPLCLLLVGGVLYLYRWIYAEVGDALPLNGGAYNCLLNTTSKFRASMAACMTILSYMATGVIFKENQWRRTSHRIILYETKMEIPPDLAEDLAFLDEVYPEINVDFVTVRGVFGPELIERLSREWRIPKNYMFIGSPAGNFPHRVAELGGVRLII